MKTKFGSASINHNGYYQIKSIVEGNRGKLLHRLIYEDFWNVSLPEEISVHHKDGNRLNNCICNLEAMPREEHIKLHQNGEFNSFYGKTHSSETKKIIKLNTSKALSSTGIYRVSKIKNNECKQGYYYAYRYVLGEKPVVISSVDLNKLKEKVLAKGLEWIEFGKEDSE